MNSLSERVEKVINEWDPINLLPLFPPDEYRKEIEAITKFVENSKDVNEIAGYIYNLFLERFGDAVFDKDKTECLDIANLLIK